MGSQAIEIGRRLAAEYAEIPNCRRILAWALHDQAVLLKADRRTEEALELIQEAIDIAKELVDTNRCWMSIADH